MLSIDITYLLWQSVCSNLLPTFIVVYFCRLILSVKSSLYVLHKSPAPVTCFANLFSQLMAYRFVAVSFEEQGFLSDEVRFIGFSLSLVRFVSYSRNLCQTQSHHDFLLLSSSFSPYIEILVHFEFIFNDTVDKSRAGVSNSFSPGAPSASRLPSKGRM